MFATCLLANISICILYGISKLINTLIGICRHNNLLCTHMYSNIHCEVNMSVSVYKKGRETTCKGGIQSRIHCKLCMCKSICIYNNAGF